MDPYIVCLVTGAAGIGAMAIGGVSHGHAAGTAHGHSGGTHGHAGGASHGHAGGAPSGHVGGAAHGHAGAAAPGHIGASAHGHAAGAAHAEGSAPAHATAAAVGHAASGLASRAAWTLMSPRVLFSVLLGLGTTGVLAGHVLGGVPLFLAASAGGVLFERFVVNPMWNFGLRFASRPALTLESAVADEALVVSGFDANGQGLIELQLDGQAVRVLGTLQPADRAVGVRLRTGDRVRVEAVDAERNRCTVSAL